MRPLADLHRHLDGSLRDATLRELAAAEGVHVPEDVRFYVGMGLHGALDRFALTDLTTYRRELADLTGIAYAGVS